MRLANEMASGLFVAFDLANFVPIPVCRMGQFSINVRTYGTNLLERLGGGISYRASHFEPFAVG